LKSREKYFEYRKSQKSLIFGKLNLYTHYTNVNKINENVYFKVNCSVKIFLKLFFNYWQYFVALSSLILVLIFPISAFKLFSTHS